MANYLVTGGAGFIGSHIVETLLQRGEGVRVLDNLSTGRRDNLAPLLDQVDFIEGDLRDEETVRRAVAGMDYVLHQAAIPSVARSVEDPISTETANVVGTLNLLMAARDAGVRRLVFAPARPGDVKHSQADISLIRQCGYQVQMDFRAGLIKTVEWYAAQ
jgi:nucleoside-diphosphate-sugar epimerase